MNPHALLRALAPQASASTYSATRTCAAPRGAPTNYSNLRGLAEDFLLGPAAGVRRIRQDEPVSADYQPDAEVVELCQELIRIDTSNFGSDQGPGEREAAERVAELLDEVGIASDLMEPEPRRTSVVARWEPEGVDTSLSPLLIHGHLDVVPANAADWSVPPFSGELADGCVWGRGAVDMKHFDAMVLSVVRARARAGVAPRRPLRLIFTADEEAGS